MAQIRVTLVMDVIGNAGDEYGNLTPDAQFVSEYLRGAADYTVPGTSIREVTAEAVAETPASA